MGTSLVKASNYVMEGNTRILYYIIQKKYQRSIEQYFFGIFCLYRSQTCLYLHRTKILEKHNRILDFVANYVVLESNECFTLGMVFNNMERVKKQN